MFEGKPVFKKPFSFCKRMGLITDSRGIEIVYFYDITLGKYVSEVLNKKEAIKPSLQKELKKPFKIVYSYIDGVDNISIGMIKTWELGMFWNYNCDASEPELKMNDRILKILNAL